MPTHHGAQYLMNAFAPYLIEIARGKLAGIDYDTLVGTGMSGALVVAVLGRALNKFYAVVRKPGDTMNHSGNPIEGKIGNRWLFVDDLVSTGATLARVKAAIREVPSIYVGHYTYGACQGCPARLMLEDYTAPVVAPPPVSLQPEDAPRTKGVNKVAIRTPYQYEKRTNWADFDASFLDMLKWSPSAIEKGVTESARKLPNIPATKSLIPLEV